jgi:hypothetical protein
MDGARVWPPGPASASAIDVATMTKMHDCSPESSRISLEMVGFPDLSGWLSNKAALSVSSLYAALPIL